MAPMEVRSDSEPCVYVKQPSSVCQSYRNSGSVRSSDGGSVSSVVGSCFYRIEKGEEQTRSGQEKL